MSDLEARIAEVIAGNDKEHAFRMADYSDNERPTFRCSCGLAATGKYHEHFNGELTAALAPVIREREAEAWDRARTEIRSIPCWYESETKNGFDLWTDAAGNATEHGARIAVMEILNTNPYKEQS